MSLLSKKKFFFLFSKQHLIDYKYLYLFFLTLIFLFWHHPVLAENPDLLDYNSSALKTFWMIISSLLIFSMNPGFAMLEAGCCSRKNFINILAKNSIVFCIAAIAFWSFGFSLMYSDSVNPFIGGIQGFFLYTPFSHESSNFPPYFSQLEKLWTGRSFAALFFFELTFAGVTASIISGAVAERIKFRAFILFSFILVAFIYPVVGHWVWGDSGLLRNSNFLNFQDFAGATVVHSVGGAAALSGALLLGTRLDYHKRDRASQALRDRVGYKPSNLGFCTLGCFILWLGWFGFNGGSAHYLASVPHIIVTTAMSSASGGIAVLFLAIWFDGKRKLGTMINGILGGLVAITGASAYVEIRWAILIGIVSSLFVLFGEYILELCQIDDPVGAIPVHLFCGFWGTIAVGLFCDVSGKYAPEYVYKYSWITQTFYQLLGWLIIVTTTFLLSSFFWLSIGNFLDWREQVAEGKTNQDMKLQLKIILRDFVRIGCRGIRVSPRLERMGSDDFFEEM